MPAMSRILYCWELGAGYGHIAAFLPVARRLRQAGHDVIFVLKNLQFADVLLGDEAFGYLQAPVYWPDGRPLPAALNYAGILANTGYTDPTSLYSRANAWRALYRHLKPDLLVFDHAPTAQLAARGLPLTGALFGGGFQIPPASHPLPALRPWLPTAPRELADTEARVLAGANAVAARLEAPTLRTLADLFETSETFLCTWPELDAYPQRVSARYWGPALHATAGSEPRWPTGSALKLFGYLRPEYPALGPLLQALAASGWSCLLHIPGASAAFADQHAGANLHICAQPLRLEAALGTCDLAVHHGGAATGAACLLAGKPQLVLPMQIEQAINARHIASIGAGIQLPAETVKPNFRALLKDLSARPDYAAAAKAFGAKYAGFEPDAQAQAIAERCLSLIETRPQAD